MQKTAFLGVAKRLPGCRSLILGILRGQIFTIHNCRTASKLQGMVLILNAATVIARNKVTKQSKYEIPRFARKDNTALWRPRSNLLEIIKLKLIKLVLRAN